MESDGCCSYYSPNCPYFGVALLLKEPIVRVATTPHFLFHVLPLATIWREEGNMESRRREEMGQLVGSGEVAGVEFDSYLLIGMCIHV